MDTELTLCVPSCRDVSFRAKDDEVREVRDTVVSPDTGTRGIANEEGGCELD